MEVVMVDAHMVTGEPPKPNGPSRTSTTTKTPPSLASKLAAVILEVTSVAKRGHNDFHNYDYATEADVLEAVRKGLAARHVVIVPRCTGSSFFERERQGKSPEFVTTADLTMTIVDGESGEAWECPWKGCGADASDKGLYKAITGGNKYFLLKLFMIPTGDDPEKEKAPKGKRERDDTAAALPLAVPGSDDAVILELAPKLAANGEDVGAVIRRFSAFVGKDGKANPGFTDPRKASSAKWKAGVREKMERALRESAKNDPGAAEAAAAFTDGLQTCPKCSKEHPPSQGCKAAA